MNDTQIFTLSGSILSLLLFICIAYIIWFDVIQCFFDCRKKIKTDKLRSKINVLFNYKLSEVATYYNKFDSMNHNEQINNLTIRINKLEEDNKKNVKKSK